MAHLALKVGENNDDSPCLSNLLCFDDGLEQVATFFSVLLVFVLVLFFLKFLIFSS
ncbi:hypothetical protein GLYMA_07G207000v4 [Glycine max]|uniref:Uncharacterized protein n=2 Tax=Glycine subgen. Soja TaxID=1462606 RepID=K7L2W5_SOYBN|nr:hypothetical protein JHK85_019790 [Glycine max]KAH1087802.1 hypothetical protein GYH30_019065 [Glycine max]KRH50193.1 hypothetical protein GLYMA_07G207000v4 [Glycine max]RZC03879.1 hypothetical protein D0Y65_018501 [Glycine soja]